MNRYLAIDLGAESGRVVCGIVDGGRISIQEVHRFANGPVAVLGSLYWDPLHLFREIKVGLTKAAQSFGPRFDALGVDTWGIDFALLDAQGQLVGNPHCYRDARTTGVMEEVLARIPRQFVYERSGGLQFMSINTLYQLRSMVLARSPQLDAAAHFLMIPDLFNFWLTGRRTVEYTNATSTQFYNSPAHTWARDLIAPLGIPPALFPEVVMPGSVIGPLLPELAAECGLEAMPVVAVASHDTASAVVAVPAEGDRFLWLSSGTWSLLGAVSDRALTSAAALEANISSYGGAGGSVLPWKNIMGLWLVQECRRIWERESARGEPAAAGYAALVESAAAAPPFLAIIDPDHPSFLAPADMPAAIQERCRATGQAVPASRGEIVRVALEALALRYLWVTERLESLLGRSFDALHVVGGGSQNRLLSQFAADALQRPVIVGPVEATAIGNVALQAVATGAFPTLAEARAAVRDSFAVERIEPGAPGGWPAAYARFCALLDA